MQATTLHPEVSHTLGPSVTFSCHAVTRTTQNEDVRTCTTYAVLESGPDISAEARGRTVWIWDERLSGNLVAAEAQKSKRSVVVSVNQCSSRAYPFKLSPVGFASGVADFCI